MLVKEIWKSLLGRSHGKIACFWRDEQIGLNDGIRKTSSPSDWAEQSHQREWLTLSKKESTDRPHVCTAGKLDVRIHINNSTRRSVSQLANWNRNSFAFCLQDKYKLWTKCSTCARFAEPAITLTPILLEEGALCSSHPFPFPVPPPFLPSSSGRVASSSSSFLGCRRAPFLGRPPLYV